jgi:HPr kinase/phosphorylase
VSIIQLFEINNIPFIQTLLGTWQIINEMTFYFEDKLTLSAKMHAVLVSVYGLGVFLTGEAGAGKSECAIELVKRGHMLVADDVVEVRKRSGGILIGKGEEIVRYHMEVRGLGIVDIRSLFGIGAILDESKIELVINLQNFSSASAQDCDRLGLEDKYTTILGIKIPELILPVKPGRNLAVLVEIASLNRRLKNRGHNAAKELNDKLIQMMSQKKNE